MLANLQVTKFAKIDRKNEFDNSVHIRTVYKKYDI